MAGLTADNRLVIAPTAVDAQRDVAYADYTGVSVLEMTDRANKVFHLIIVTGASTVNPNGDTTYDGAPIGSMFVDGPGGKFYVKSSAAAWTEIT